MFCCGPPALEFKSVRAQLNFGRRGEQAISECAAAFTSYSTACWAGLSLTRQLKFKLALGLVKLCAECWFRLVHYYRQPKFDVLDICSGDHNTTHVTSQCQQILDKKQRCTSCVDHFANTWFQRLLSPSHGERAFRSLSSVASIVRVCSVKCEKNICSAKSARQVGGGGERPHARGSQREHIKSF